MVLSGSCAARLGGCISTIFDYQIFEQCKREFQARNIIDIIVHVSQESYALLKGTVHKSILQILIIDKVSL